MKRFYIIMMVLGTVLPWAFFLQFFSQNGVDIPLFISELFGNNAAGGFSMDLIISSLVFWVWSYRDARQRGIKHWWVVVPMNLLGGLSLALPFYLYQREES